MREKVRKIRACLMLICALMLMPLTDQALPFEGTAIVAEAAASKKVKLNKSSVKLNKGKSYTLKVYNKGSKKVKWSSKNKKIATVSSSGKVTAKSKGTTYVYAKVGGKTLKCKVTVVVPAPKISKTSVTINKGKSYTLKVSNASSRIKWSSKNRKVATVSSKGKVIAKGKGTTYIYAKVSGKTLKCKVTVKEPAVVKKYTVSYGKSKSLTFSGASSKTRWKSSDSSIVSVSSTKGKKVTAKVKRVGKATVTATTSGKKTYQFVITGKAISKPKFTKTSQTVGKGKTITLSISGKKGKPSSWKSSNTSIATVDSKGRVRCLKSGTVTISCIVDGVVIKTKIVVPADVQTQPSKPSTTPQTEAPVRPQPEIRPPQTEAPQTETRPPQTEVPQTEIQPPQTEVPQTEPPQTEAPQTETQPPETETEKPAFEIINVELNGYINGGDRILIILDTSLSVNNISCVVNNVNNNCPGLLYHGIIRNDSRNYIAVDISGWIKGEYSVTISGGGTTVVVPIHVTSTEPDWLQYCSWIDTMLSSEWYANGDPVETFKMLGAWLVDNRDYDASNTQFQRLYRMGGDCRAYEMIFIDIARRYFGLNAYTSNPDGGGHAWAIVEIGGTKWSFDAGSNGSAGTREFMMGKLDNSYGLYYSKSTGWIEVK